MSSHEVIGVIGVDSDFHSDVNGQAQAFFGGMSDSQPTAVTLGPDGKITITGAVDSYQD